MPLRDATHAWGNAHVHRRRHRRLCLRHARHHLRNRAGGSGGAPPWWAAWMHWEEGRVRHCRHVRLHGLHPCIEVTPGHGPVRHRGIAEPWWRQGLTRHDACGIVACGTHRVRRQQFDYLLRAGLLLLLQVLGEPLHHLEVLAFALEAERLRLPHSRSQDLLGFSNGLRRQAGGQVAERLLQDVPIPLRGSLLVHAGQLPKDAGASVCGGLLHSGNRWRCDPGSRSQGKIHVLQANHLLRALAHLGGAVGHAARVPVRKSRLEHVRGVLELHRGHVKVGSCLLTRFVRLGRGRVHQGLGLGAGDAARKGEAGGRVQGGGLRGRHPRGLGVSNHLCGALGYAGGTCTLPCPTFDLLEFVLRQGLKRGAQPPFVQLH
mmetsp:Transcript_21148/g.58639  ORF Transcript_21148/g.58639 Transcript_21148/m.58639 type:complete len:375 (+) Transcript_21148:799-1923(+)